MRQFILFCICVFCSFALPAQKKNTGSLITISGPGITRNVSSDEFYRIYMKNNSAAVESKKSINEYLDLFVNFKLKVTEAERLGYDTVSAFLKEFKGYRDQLAKPYLTDTLLRKQLIDESYKRMQSDVRVSHIMVRVDFVSATPADTLAAYNKIMTARKRILAGEDFGKVAKEFSEDTYANNNGGDLGFFTAFKFPYSFESAAYNAPVGKVTMPVRTTFGYHLLKVTEVRKAMGRIKVAHIMKVTPEGMTPAQVDSVKSIVLSIMQKIKAGADFTALADSFSDDRRTAASGGELAMFGVGQMIPEFESACFALKNNGDISPEPLRTMFGWHIIKRIDRQEVGSFAESKPSIESAISRGDRADHLRNLYIRKLKISNKLKVNSAALVPFYSFDTAMLAGEKPMVNDGMNQPLLIFPNANYIQQDFIRYLTAHPSKQNWSLMPVRSYIDKQFAAFTNEKVLEYEDTQLEQRYAPFRELLSEYHDGILLFNIMDERVWSKAVKDTSGILEYFQANQNNYIWGERLDAVLYNCSSRELADLAKAMAETADTPAAMVAAACKTTSAKDTILFEQDKFTHDSDPVISIMEWKKGVSGLYEKDGKFFFAVISGIISPQQKTLDEARGQVISDYQDYLEKQWITELKALYKVQIDSSLLQRLSGN